MKVIASSFCLFFLINLSFAQNNSFNGIFSNTQIGLTLSLTENNGTFTGFFQLQGNSFPITAQIQGENTLVGSYPYYGNEVPIQLMSVNGSYLLVTEGVTIPMAFSASNNADNQLVSIEEELPETTIDIPVAAVSNTNNKADGRTFSDPASGFRFNIPNDWVGQQIEDGSYLIGHKTKPGFALVLPHEYNSLQQIYQESIGGIQEEGIQLFPTDGINKYGSKGLIGTFTGTIQGQAVKAHAISLLSPFGGGLTMLIAVKTDLYKNEYLTILQSIASSVAFSKPKTSALARQWKERITGKKLLYMKTANGFSDKITIELCSSGNFGYNSNSSGMSTGTTTLTYAGQNGGQGTWKIITRGQIPVLILSFHNGELYEYKLTNRDSNGQINLNGRRYFIQDGSGC